MKWFMWYAAVFFFLWKSLCGIMAKVLNRGLEISEFELQSRYYVHFRTTFGKSMNPVIPPPSMV